MKQIHNRKKKLTPTKGLGLGLGGLGGLGVFKPIRTLPKFGRFGLGLLFLNLAICPLLASPENKRVQTKLETSVGTIINGHIVSLTQNGVNVQTPLGLILLTKDQLSEKSWQDVLRWEKNNQKQVEDSPPPISPIPNENQTTEGNKEEIGNSNKIPPRDPSIDQNQAPQSPQAQEESTPIEGELGEDAVLVDQESQNISPQKMEENPQATTINFLTEKITLRYPLDIKKLSLPTLSQENIKNFLDQLNQIPKESFLSDLETIKRKYSLNDFFSYVFYLQAVSKIMDEDPKNPKTTLIVWYLLTKSGKDCVLYYNESELWADIYINIEKSPSPKLDNNSSQKALVGHPNIMLEATPTGLVASNPKGKSIEKGGMKSLQAYYLLGRTPKGGEGKLFGYTHSSPPKKFDLQISQFPKLKPNTTPRKVNFNYGGRGFVLDLTVDKNVQDLLENYPEISPLLHSQIPISATLKASLAKEIRKISNTTDRTRNADLLSALTQTGFVNPKEPTAKRLFSAEEVVLNSEANAQGRCALFAQLGKEILKVPMILIEYNENTKQETNTSKDKLANDKTPEDSNPPNNMPAITIAAATPPSSAQTRTPFRWNSKNYFDYNPAGIQKPPLTQQTIGQSKTLGIMINNL